MGYQGTTPRIRRPRRLTTAAAPTLLGMAAAACLSVHTPAGQATTPATGQHATVRGTGHQSGTARLMAATRPADRPSALPAWYTVEPGDTLSGIAGRLYHDPAAWPVLYWANSSQIRWADVIQAGQVLRVPVEPARIPAPPTQLGPSQASSAADEAPQQASATTTPAPASEPAQGTAQPNAATVSTSGGYPGGAFGQCVVARESGGNAQVMNSTGHYGLYQFSYATWVEYGGSPADFGHASVAEQNQVFANALASGGQSNWSAYDGC